jgi:hypothetical protein
MYRLRACQAWRNVATYSGSTSIECTWRLCTDRKAIDLDRWWAMNWKWTCVVQTIAWKQVPSNFKPLGCLQTVCGRPCEAKRTVRPRLENCRQTERIASSILYRSASRRAAAARDFRVLLLPTWFHVPYNLFVVYLVVHILFALYPFILCRQSSDRVTRMHRHLGAGFGGFGP